MKRVLFTCSALCALCLALSAAALAQAGANFAGTWELDKSKSKMDERMAARINSITLTVTQDDKEIKVERKQDMAPPPGGGAGGGGGGRGGGFGGMGGGNQAFKLDGSEVVTETQRGKSTTKVKWSGNILEVNTSGTFNTPNGDGGKALKVHTTRETPNGPMETTYVYNKK
jgi:hypothetical protein